jgi:uncharacterized damage-inducible protein DinB
MKMFVKRIVQSLALALLICTVAIHAQDAAKKPAPKPPSSPSQVLLESWNDIGRKLIAMAEDFPEDKYDFKPTPAQRSFAEQLLHAAGSNYYFINSVLGKKLPADDPKRADFKSKAEIVAFVKKAFADGAAVIKQKGDAGMNDLVDYGGQQTRMSDIAWGIMEHSGEHYGQLVVYYRLSGLVPPESRPKK